MLTYHTTVSSGLQAVARLARLSPYVVVITAPVEKAEAIAERQVKRYPSITASHTTRTALRRAGYPAVQLVVMPPREGEVVMLLMSQDPIDSRENWQQALEPEAPLTWRNYSLTTTKEGRITWRLSAGTRDHYKQRIARLITGRGPVRKDAQGKRLPTYQLPPESARAQVLKLAQHMQAYPGFAGVRDDIQDLAQYATKVWKSTHPKEPYPAWPYHPYLPYLKPKTAPLSDIIKYQPDPQEEPDHDPEEASQ